DRRTAIARLRIEWLDQRTQRRPRHHPLHLGKKRCPPRRLGIAVKPRCRQRQLLHSPNPTHQSTPPPLYHNRCSWLLERFLNSTVARNGPAATSRFVGITWRTANEYG